MVDANEPRTDQPAQGKPLAIVGPVTLGQASGPCVKPFVQLVPGSTPNPGPPAGISVNRSLGGLLAKASEKLGRVMADSGAQSCQGRCLVHDYVHGLFSRLLWRFSTAPEVIISDSARDTGMAGARSPRDDGMTHRCQWELCSTRRRGDRCMDSA